MLNFQVEIYKVLGTESDITHLIDRFYHEFNHKAVYQLLTRSPKESAARVLHLSNYGGLLGICTFVGPFDWWNTLACNYNSQSFFYCFILSFLSLV